MVSFCASCPCYLMSWWRRLRGSCGANGRLSIYIVPSRLLRLVGRLVMLLVPSVSLLRLVAVSCLLPSRCASYRSILSSCLVFVLVSFLSLSLVVADALAIPFVERLMSVASRRRVSRVLVYCSSCILSWASRLVPRAVLIRSVLLLSPSVSGRRGVAWMSLSSCGHGGGVSVPVFLIGSAGERHETTGMRRFIQLIFSYSYSRGWVRAHGVMISIWDGVDGA